MTDLKKENHGKKTNWTYTERHFASKLERNLYKERVINLIMVKLSLCSAANGINTSSSVEFEYFKKAFVYLDKGLCATSPKPLFMSNFMSSICNQSKPFARQKEAIAFRIFDLLDSSQPKSNDGKFLKTLCRSSLKNKMRIIKYLPTLLKKYLFSVVSSLTHVRDWQTRNIYGLLRRFQGNWFRKVLAVHMQTQIIGEVKGFIHAFSLKVS